MQQKYTYLRYANVQVNFLRNHVTLLGIFPVQNPIGRSTVTVIELKMTFS